MTARHSLTPNSVLQLVLIAFLIITLPLLLALGFATLKVDGLSRQSSDAVYGAVQAIQAGRTIYERITAMERSYRQFVILQDPALLARYREQRAEFQTAFALFSNTPLDRERTTNLRMLFDEEEALNRDLSATTPTDPLNEALLNRFAELQQQAREIPIESYQVALRETQSLKQSANHAQRLLIVLGLTLLPGTAALAGLFTLFITRPLNQMDRAIRQLGNENLESAIRVGGPRDLRELGERLEWLRKRMLDLEQQKLNFLRHISHDLKTPLTAIREGSELLGDIVLGSLNPAQVEVTGILTANAKKLQRQIEELLRFNEYRFRQRNELLPISASQIINRVLGDHAIHMKTKGLELYSKISEGVISGDEEMMRIVIDNLVSNAVKYSPQGGLLNLRAENHEHHYRVDVIDSGPGIPHEERSKVFEAFFRGQASRDSSEKGSGLGLAIAADYARQFGATIQVLDCPSGAHFRIEIPLYKPLQGVNRPNAAATMNGERHALKQKQ